MSRPDVESLYLRLFWGVSLFWRNIVSLRQLVSSVGFAGVVSLIAYQLVQANVGQVTGVRINPTENGVEFRYF